MQKPSGWGCALRTNDPVTARAVPFEKLPKTIPMGYYGGRKRVLSDSIRQIPNAALAVAYKQPIEIYGPTYKSMAVEDGKVRIQYSHIGKGLAVPAGKPLQGFIIAGVDKGWHWADAKLDGEAVLVFSPKIVKPVAVRYAWAVRIPWATLFSQNGLPALPFRTDDWPD